MSIDLDGPVPCRYCGGALTWVEQEREPGKPPRWDGRCACGCIHDDAPEVPTWRTWAQGDQRIRALLALVYDGVLAAGMDAERAAVVSALERWAEEACDPWMSFCADRIKRGDHRREEKL